MSRISRVPIVIPAGVSYALQTEGVSVKGSLGEMFCSMLPIFFLEQEENKLFVRCKKETLSQKDSMMIGTFCRLLSNAFKGVSEGFEKILELVGVGYKAELQGTGVKLSLGYSHDIFYQPPEGVAIKVEKMDKVMVLRVSGRDKQQVGQVASQLVKFRKPEPYKGKGVRIRGTFIRMKQGKTKK
jgi:large subunit ribosomal protein L6